jgi:succinyl-diaminopimelate desuccinylase
MDENLYQKINIWFETHKEDMVSDIMRLVRIASVSDRNTDCKPFGQGCHDALEEMLTIAREHGFKTENYEYYVGSIGKDEKNWENTIGFWNHLDVVPAGTNWDYEPFEPVVKEHFLIGRGAQDNKGPEIGIMYMMQCIQELKIPMKHELCLFVGCDEERGMEDLSYYTSHYRTPKLSMIADSGFPVCYGEKGIIEGQMVSDAEVSGKILELYGGNASNMIPDFAVALLKRTPELEQELAVCCNTMEIALEDAAIRVTARGTSKHSAFPEGSKNAIHELCRKGKRRPFPFGRICQRD